MDVKKIVLLVGALIIAGVTAFMAENMFTGAAAPQAQASAGRPAAGPEVLVATRTLPVGTIIDAEALPLPALARRPGPGRLFHPRQEGAADPAEPDRHRRAHRDHRRPADDPRLADPARRARLPRRGARARACAPSRSPVSATSGVAGFVFPGDRVDMVLTQEVEGGGDGAPLHASETILRNMRVLAADQRIDARDDDGNQVAQPVSTVTLRGDAEDRREDRGRADHRPALAVAALARRQQCRAGARDRLRRGAGAAERRSEGRAADAARGREPPDRQRHRPITVGADVSRFQRSTVPGRARREQQRASGIGRLELGDPGRQASWPRRPRRPGQQCDARSGGSKIR